MGRASLLNCSRVWDLLGGSGGGGDDGEEVRVGVRVLVSWAADVVPQVLQRMDTSTWTVCIIVVYAFFFSAP